MRSNKYSETTYFIIFKQLSINKLLIFMYVYVLIKHINIHRLFINIDKLYVNKSRACSDGRVVKCPCRCVRLPHVAMQQGSKTSFVNLR